MTYLKENLTFALPAGRMLEEAVETLKAAGFDCPYDSKSRKLVFSGIGADYLIARPSDVPVYVARGAADLGIVGKDGLAESGEEVYELMDLGFGKCRFVLAAPASRASSLKEELEREGRIRSLRIATKFPVTTREYTSGKVMNPEVIILKGAVELAPAIGLSDAIVDVMDSGRTLRENGLAVVDSISESSARLIANRSSYGIKSAAIAELLGRLRNASAGAGGSI